MYCLGEKWGFTGIVKPTELFLGLVSLYSHAEPNCSMFFRYVEIFSVCILLCRGECLLWKLVLHFILQQKRGERGLKGKGILIYHVPSDILNQRCLKKKAAIFDIKKISKSYLILIKLKYEYLTAYYHRKINLKYGRLAATCSSSKCINEIKKIFKVIKKIAFFFQSATSLMCCSDFLLPASALYGSAASFLSALS